MSMGLIHGGARSPSLISDRVLSERPQLLALWGRFVWARKTQRNPTHVVPALRRNPSVSAIALIAAARTRVFGRVADAAGTNQRQGL